MTSKSLPERMREAAETLTLANARYLKSGEEAVWDPISLKAIAEKWEAEDAERADREALVEKLTNELRYVADWGMNLYGLPSPMVSSNNFRRILADYDIKKRK